jgi:parvulin-like peptidyl-prolyl isomerase
MDYNHIKEYLNKFKEILFFKEENYRIISGIIERNTSIKIDNKFIQIKPPFIYIKASPLFRNEILIKKEKILKEILEVSPNSNFTDIK